MLYIEHVLHGIMILHTKWILVWAVPKYSLVSKIMVGFPKLGLIKLRLLFVPSSKLMILQMYMLYRVHQRCMYSTSDRDIACHSRTCDDVSRRAEPQNFYWVGRHIYHASPSYGWKHWLKVCYSWASYKIRKILGCTCAGNASNVFPATDFKGNR